MASNKTCASVIPWQQVCKMLDKVQKEVRDKKKIMLTKFIDSYRELLSKNSENTTDSFFPALRILLPDLDRDRGAYGIKEHKLAELYIRILGLKKESVDGQKLLNYRKPKSGGSGVGDFAGIAYYVLQNRCPLQGDLSLYDVDNYLTQIAESHAAKNQDIVEKSLLHMIRKMSATEQKWLIRVLLKDMHLGIGQTSIFSAWHPDAKDYYDVNNSLLKVCLTLRNPEVRLHEIEISLFSPFRPMLAERAVLDKVETQMKQKTYYVENKYDGERSQIHRKGNQYKYFSRNGFDFSSNFGTSPLNGLFSPHVHALFAAHVDEVILDGEMIGWSKRHKTFVTKGEQMDVKNLKEFGDYQVCFCAFDILYLNGRVLTNLPLSQRLKELKEVIKPLEGRIIITSQLEVTTKQDVVDALNVAIDDREEGVILKDPASVYQPASRRAGWIKVKPEYVDSLVPELDLLIIGGYYGTGKRRGIVSHFLVGVAESGPDLLNSRPKAIHSFGRVGSGYTVSELEDLIARLSKQTSPKQPSNVVVSREKPNVWYIPEKSCVVQVKAAEIVKSDLYRTGLTLRFPRVEKIRSDKSWFEILNTDQLHELVTEASGKLASKHFISDSSDSPKKKMARKTQQPSLPEYFRPADVTNLVKKANIFAQKEFCIVSGSKSFSKQKLETLVAEHGGTFTQHPGPNTYCIVSDQLSIRVQNYLNTHQYNIVKPSWVIECVEASKIVMWNPVQVFQLLKEEEQRMNEEYDSFGDSFYDATDPQKLKDVMNQMTDESSWKDIELDFQSEFDALTSEPGNCQDFFRGVNGFFTSDGKTTDQALLVTQLKLRLYGGTVSAYLNNDTTHLITSERNKNILRPSEFPGKHLVSEEWIETSIQKGKRVCERNLC